MSLPKEEGRTCDAARLETAYTSTLAQQLKEINNTAPQIWTDEGWRLLNLYQRTGGSRHLQAFSRHVAGVRTRLTGVLSQ